MIISRPLSRYASFDLILLAATRVCFRGLPDASKMLLRAGAVGSGRANRLEAGGARLRGEPDHLCAQTSGQPPVLNQRSKRFRRLATHRVTLGRIRHGRVETAGAPHGVAPSPTSTRIGPRVRIGASLATGFEQEIPPHSIIGDHLARIDLVKKAVVHLSRQWKGPHNFAKPRT